MTSSALLSTNPLGFPEGVSGSVPLLWLLSTISGQSDALITNISVIQTWRWFFALTPFESVFLGMLMMQITTLQLLGVLPLNVNQLVHGMSSGRRKRATIQCKRSEGKEELAGYILNILHRVDKYGCVFLTLCQAQKQANFGVKLPESILLTLSTLNTYSKCKTTDSDPVSSTNITLVQKLLPLYQEAINVGFDGSQSRNSTNCEKRYSECPLEMEDILAYLHQIRLDDMFT